MVIEIALGIVLAVLILATISFWLPILLWGIGIIAAALFGYVVYDHVVTSDWSLTTDDWTTIFVICVYFGLLVGGFLSNVAYETVEEET